MPTLSPTAQGAVQPATLRRIGDNAPHCSLDSEIPSVNSEIAEIPSVNGQRRGPACDTGPRARSSSGYDIALTRAIADAVPVPVIASGGVGNLAHLVDGIRDGHATAVLAASIFHFGEHSVREAKDYMAKAGLPMRLDP